MTEQIEFCVLVESGPLEKQALLLIESLRRFGGRYADSLVTAISPRSSRRPTKLTKSRLEDLGARYFELNLISNVPEYGPTFKVLALAELERLKGPMILVQIDSDTLFCDEPNFILYGVDAAARPVDVKGICTSGLNDDWEQYWLKLADITGISLNDLPFVNTTVCNSRIRATYNGGLIVANRELGLYQKSAKILKKIYQSGLRPYEGIAPIVNAGAGSPSANGAQWWGVSQIAFSLATAKLGCTVGLLDKAHNIPVHITDVAQDRPIHLHYHSLLEDKYSATKFLESPIIKCCSSHFHSWLMSKIIKN